MAIRPISDTYFPGQVIDDRNLRAGIDDAGAVAIGAGVYATAYIGTGTNTPMIFTYTPPVNVWWEVDSWLYMTKEDAAYGYAYNRMILSPNDADNKFSSDAILGGMHLSVNRYATIRVSEKWKLTAGTTYTVTTQTFGNVTGFFQQRGDRYSGMKAVARVR
jgi:hypothetical protein